MPTEVSLAMLMAIVAVEPDAVEMESPAACRDG